MMEKKSTTPPGETPQNAPAGSDDPFVYASIVDGFMTDRNPFQILVGDIGRMFSVVINLGKTRKLAQNRIDHLQQQVNKVQHSIAETTSQTTGSRLNKLR